MQVPGQSNDGASSHDRKPTVEVRSVKEILTEDSWVLKRLGMEDDEADNLVDVLPGIQYWSIDIVSEESGHGSEQRAEISGPQTADDSEVEHGRARREREFVFQGGISKFHAVLHDISEKIYAKHGNYPFPVTETTTHAKQTIPFDHATWVVQGPITYSRIDEWAGHNSRYIERDTYGTGTAVPLPGSKLLISIKARAGFEPQMNRGVDWLVQKLVGMGWVRKDAPSGQADPGNGDVSDKADSPNRGSVDATLAEFPKEPPKPDANISRNDVFDWYYRGGRLYCPRLGEIAMKLGVVRATIYTWHSKYKDSYGEEKMPDYLSRYSGRYRQAGQ